MVLLIGKVAMPVLGRKHLKFDRSLLGGVSGTARRMLEPRFGAVWLQLYVDNCIVFQMDNVPKFINKRPRNNCRITEIIPRVLILCQTNANLQRYRPATAPRTYSKPRTQQK